MQETIKIDPNCDYCRYRQKSLDPEGCFKQVSSTGFVGRWLVRMEGCESFRVVSE